MNKFLLLLLAFGWVSLNTFAQIFTKRENNYSITITPSGIIDSPVPLAPTTNTVLGDISLLLPVSVNHNTVVGSFSLTGLTGASMNLSAGNNNTVVGSESLTGTKNSSNNSSFGSYAMNGGIGYITTDGNAAFGVRALSYLNTGTNNAAFGVAALSQCNAGSHNAAFGALAAGENNGSFNTVFGLVAFQNHTTGDNNTVFGRGAFYSDQTGTDNTVLGVSALQENISGNANTVMGRFAMGKNKTGSFNTALGGAASFYNSGGESNSTIGNKALFLNETGSRNTVIGYEALHSTVSGSGNIAIGPLAGYNNTASNQLFIDANTVPFGANVTLIGGDFSARKVCIGCNLTLDGATEFKARTEAFQVQGNAFKTAGSGNWIIPSDRRLKTAIVSLDQEQMLQKILQMRGVTYEWTSHPEQGIQYGFIAQELREIFPTKVYENNEGYLSASYGSLTPVFVEALKALNDRMLRLEQSQKGMNETIKAIN